MIIAFDRRTWVRKRGQFRNWELLEVYPEFAVGYCCGGRYFAVVENRGQGRVVFWSNGKGRSITNAVQPVSDAVCEYLSCSLDERLWFEAFLDKDHNGLWVDQIIFNGGKVKWRPGWADEPKGTQRPTSELGFLCELLRSLFNFF